MFPAIGCSALFMRGHKYTIIWLSSEYICFLQCESTVQLCLSLRHATLFLWLTSQIIINDTLFCSLTLVTFRYKFPADSSSTQRKGARQFFFTRWFNPFSVKCQGHRVKFLGEGIRHALRCPCSVLNFVAVGSFFDAIYYQCFFILFCRQMVHQQ